MTCGVVTRQLSSSIYVLGYSYVAPTVLWGSLRPLESTPFLSITRVLRRVLSLVMKRRFIVPSEIVFAVVDSTHGHEYENCRSRNDIQSHIACIWPQRQIGTGLRRSAQFFLRVRSGIRAIWAYLCF